jgi:hypothetical protein
VLGLILISAIALALHRAVSVGRHLTNNSKTMKRKLTFPIIVLAAAVLVASRQQGFAPVGYVNVGFSPGLNLVANPLNQPTTTNNANYLMPGVPDGSLLFRFDPVTQRYMNAATYFTGVGWYPPSGNTNDPALILNPGEGFFIHVPQPWTNTFVGELLLGSLTNPIPANFSLKASMVPQAGGLQTVLAFPPVQDDFIWQWNPTSQVFTAQSPYLYDSSAWSPSEPQISVAEGFFVHRDPLLANPTNWWIRNFVLPSPPNVPAPQQRSLQPAQKPSAPAIANMTIQGGKVTLNISNPSGESYDVQFSTDGLAWKTVAAQQTGAVWTGPCPGGAQGYYQVVNP